MHWGSFAIGFAVSTVLIVGASLLFSLWMVKGGGLEK